MWALEQSPDRLLKTFAQVSTGFRVESQDTPDCMINVKGGRKFKSYFSAHCPAAERAG
jgi:hypothetical protein